MASSHILQIFLRVAIQNQIRITQRVSSSTQPVSMLKWQALSSYFMCDFRDMVFFLIRFRTHSDWKRTLVLLPEKTKNPNPSPIEKRFGFSILAVVLPVDIPTGWEPRTNKSPTGAFVAPPQVGPCCSSPLIRCYS